MFVTKVFFFFYLASEDDADDNSIDKPKARNTPVSGWSPSPKKSKCGLNTHFY